MKIQFFDNSRGELIRKVYGEDRNILHIQMPIMDLMGRIKNAELVSEKITGIGAYYGVYFMLPESVCVKFEIEGKVQGYLYGTESSIKNAEERIFKAFKK